DLIRECTPEKTARVCGLEVEEVLKTARIFGKAPSALSLWSMGLKQSSRGTTKNNALINLHLATGKIGKPGSGPFSLTGQPNAMAGREVGGLSNMLPGYRSVEDPQHREKVERHWAVPRGSIAPKPGLTALEQFEAL